MKTLNYSYRLLCVIGILFFTICCNNNDEILIAPPAISNLEAEYTVVANEVLELTPNVSNDKNATYEWWFNEKLVATTPAYTFKAPETDGNYKILFKVQNKGGLAQKEINIKVGSFTNLSVNSYTLLNIKAPKSLENKKEFNWEVIESSGSLYRLAHSKTATPVFIAEQGSYTLQVTADGLNYKYLIEVGKEPVEQTPYIAKVFDYLPAPGQFVNTLPKYKKGDTKDDMIKKVAEQLVGEESNMITLGGWGGYVVFGFDHTIINMPGKCDFRVKGNAFVADANPRPDAPIGGSCEPAIIYVGYDKNKNGQPDEDEWYEIKGSGNFTAENEPWYPIAVGIGNDTNTFRDYEMTYYKPETEEATETGDFTSSGFTSIKNYIRWTNNKGKEGYKVKNIYHNQSYYPLWINEDKITYKGIRLADNGLDESEDPEMSYFVLYAYRYGYVDNYANNDDRSAIDIDWAIDKNGNSIELPGIDFIKVCNAIDKENGWLGEASTEVSGGEDLHMLKKDIESKSITEKK